MWVVWVVWVLVGVVWGGGEEDQVGEGGHVCVCVVGGGAERVGRQGVLIPCVIHAMSNVHHPLAMYVI